MGAWVYYLVPSTSPNNTVEFSKLSRLVKRDTSFAHSTQSIM